MHETRGRQEDISAPDSKSSGSQWNYSGMLLVRTVIHYAKGAGLTETPELHVNYL